MLLDPHDFDVVWRHICTCAAADQGAGALIPSFAGRKDGGNWVVDVQPEKICVKSRVPKGKGFRCLKKSEFYREWKDLVSTGVSTRGRNQVVWDMFDRYFTQR